MAQVVENHQLPVFILFQDLEKLLSMVEEYMPHPTLVMDLKQPLTLTNTVERFDVITTVKGGGFTGQAGAIRLGIARALLEASADYRAPLKVAGMLTRDSRAKERKKYGLKAARRAPQFSKR